MEYLHGWLVCCGKHGRDKVVHLVVELIVAVLPLMDLLNVIMGGHEVRAGVGYPRIVDRMCLFAGLLLLFCVLVEKNNEIR